VSQLETAKIMPEIMSSSIRASASLILVSLDSRNNIKSLNLFMQNLLSTRKVLFLQKQLRDHLKK
jgi:hypothetical protein